MATPPVSVTGPLLTVVAGDALDVLTDGTIPALGHQVIACGVSERTERMARTLAPNPVRCVGCGAIVIGGSRRYFEDVCPSCWNTFLSLNAMTRMDRIRMARRRLFLWMHDRVHGIPSTPAPPF